MQCVRTPGNSNLLYVMGAGQLKSGLIGDVDPAAGAVGWDQETGIAGGAYAGRGAPPG